MKPLILVLMVLHISRGEAQINWRATTDWKIYNPGGTDIFKLPADSLAHLRSYSLQHDSMQQFLDTITALPRTIRPAWMGGILASFIFNGEVHKIEISSYAGFFYDEKLKTYFQLPSESKDTWFAYLNNCLLAIE